MPSSTRLQRTCAAFLLVGMVACGGSAGEPAPSGVTSLKAASGDNQSGTVGSQLSAPVVITALDASGRPVSGVVVAFAVDAGGGSITPSRATSDASGTVSARWTLGTAAGTTQRVIGTVVEPAGAVPGVTVTAIATPGAATTIVVTPSSVSARAGELIATPIVAELRDTYGNRVSVSGTTLTAALEGASFTTLGGATTARTDPAGIATLSGMSASGRAGVFTMIVGGSGLASARVPLTLAGGAARKVEISGSATVLAIARASGPPLVARVLDEWDNASSGVKVTFSIVGGAVLGEATSIADGTATLTTWTAPAIGSYQISMSIAGVTSPARITLEARGGSVTALAPGANNPPTGVVGNDTRVFVVATDAGGNGVANVTVDWELGSQTGQVVTAADGSAPIGVRLAEQAGINQIVARLGTLSTTISVRGTAGPVRRIVTVADSLSGTAGTTISIAFAAFDQYGNAVLGVPISAGEADGAPAPTTSNTDVNGVARFNVVLDPYAGPVAYAATAPTNVSAASAAMTVLVTSTRGTLRLPSFACVGAVSTDVVLFATVYGVDGRPAAGVAVTAAAAAGNGSVALSGDPTTLGPSVTGQTNSFGVLGYHWRAPAVPGNYILTVTAAAGFDALSPATVACRAN